jgi:hypothetical protein
VPPRDNRHPASFGLHLSQQRRLLFGRPLPPPLNPRNDLHVHRSGLLLELQKEAPQEANIAAKAALRYTWQGGRLPFTRGEKASGHPDHDAGECGVMDL